MPQALLDIYDSLGLEAQNTVRNFMLFLAAQQEEQRKNEAALAALKACQETAEKAGVADMSMEEIDAEIALVRQERYEAKISK